MTGPAIAVLSQVTRHMNTSSPVVGRERSLGSQSTQLKQQHLGLVHATQAERTGALWDWDQMAIIRGWPLDWVCCFVGLTVPVFS